tara:strand:+ start:607 stop:864 length:258 start_codon:yes stop_codon:yes gene_type:complete
MSNTTQRSLYEIAKEIRKDWKATAKNGIYFGAVPYLDAMATLDKPTDKYGMDSAKSIILYFLSNATSWRGETAKRVKLELKAMSK